MSSTACSPHLGLARFEQEKWAEAERAFAKAVEIDPEHADARERLESVQHQLRLGLEQAAAAAGGAAIEGV